MSYLSALPLDRRIEVVLEPGRPIEADRVPIYLDRLQHVFSTVLGLAEDDPQSAITHVQTFVMGCLEKAEEIEDDGSFASFVHALFVAWVKLRQMLAADPAQTAALLLRHLREDTRGICQQLPWVLVPVLRGATREAVEPVLLDHLVATSPEGEAAPQVLDLRKQLAAARGDVSVYEALCDEPGRLAARDCAEIARMRLARCEPDVALGWAERGLAALIWEGAECGATRDLYRLQMAARAGLGREDELRDVAWKRLRGQPTQRGLDRLLLAAPAEERDAWRERALDGALRWPLETCLELLLEVDERTRMALAVRQAHRRDVRQVAPATLQRVARRLEDDWPVEAARAYEALAIGRLRHRRQRTALEGLPSFAAAKRLLEAAGQGKAWRAMCEHAARLGQRNTLFLEGLAAVAAGSFSDRPFGLQDRARARWAP
ncbi:MAG: hypothetical protein AB7T63_06705 [Planctomycetota bacterium]